MALSLSIESIYLDIGEGAHPYPSVAGKAPGPAKLDNTTDWEGTTDSWRLKTYPRVQIAEANMGPSTQRVTSTEVGLMVIECYTDADIIGVAPFDLLPLVPTKFHTSDQMVDLIWALSTVLASWTAPITELPSLINPTKCPDDYLPYLAAGIGATFDSTYSDAQIRQLIIDSPELYKNKGSRYGLTLLANSDYMRHADLWAASTSDYDAGTFSETDPGGAAFRTPHTNVYCRLTAVDGSNHLLNQDETSKVTQFQTEYERCRPVTVYPHWRVFVTGRVGAVDETVTNLADVDATMKKETVPALSAAAALQDIIASPASAKWELFRSSGSQAGTGVSCDPVYGPDGAVAWYRIAVTYAAVSNFYTSLKIWSSGATTGSSDPFLFLEFPGIKCSSGVPARFEVEVPASVLA